MQLQSLRRHQGVVAQGLPAQVRHKPFVETRHHRVILPETVYAYCCSSLRLHPPSRLQYWMSTCRVAGTTAATRPGSINFRSLSLSTSHLETSWNAENSGECGLGGAANISFAHQGGTLSWCSKGRCLLLSFPLDAFSCCVQRHLL